MTRQFLRRYTDLPSVLSILRSRAITLLSPDSWDDRNDRNLMAAYQRQKKYKTVLALCFSQVPETYHHWKVFTAAKTGICVVFEKERLVSALLGSGVKSSRVTYKTIHQLKESPPTVDELPFTKRAAYTDEKEFRLLYTSKSKQLESKDAEVPIGAFEKIVVNPWLAEPLVAEVRRTIQLIPGFETLEVLQRAFARPSCPPPLRLRWPAPARFSAAR